MKIKPIQFKIQAKQFEYNGFLFFLAYGLYLFAAIWHCSFFSIQFGDSFYKWALFFSAFLLVVKECINLKTVFRGFVVALIVVLMAVITYFTHNSDIIMNHLLWILLFCFSARNIEFNKIAEFTLKLEGILLLLVVLSSVLGIIDNYVDMSGRIRYYLGFKYPLFPSTLLFNISALLIWQKKDLIKWKTLIFLFIINAIIFYFTQSRLAFGLFVLMLLCTIGIKLHSSKIESYTNRRRKQHRIAKVLVLSYILCMFISLGITLSYSSSSTFQNKVNNALGNRLALGQNSLKKNGVKPFGAFIEMSGNGLDDKGQVNLSSTNGEYNYVDCMYIQILQDFGWIFTAIVLTLMTIAMYKTYKKRDWYMLMICTILAIHGIIDDLIINVYYNTFWLIIASLVLRPFIYRIKANTNSDD